MNIVEERWAEIIEYLRVEHELTNVSFNTWIKPMQVLNVVDETAYIVVPSNPGYIEKKYGSPLTASIGEVTGEEFVVKFISEEDDSVEEIKALTSTSSITKAVTAAELAGLHPKYSFDTFVVGANSRFAHAAALAVAESPGEVYNPLFIHGGVGLGKTHLMHSIGRFILEKDPNKKVLYITSDTFTNELIDSLKMGRTRGNESAMAQFREKYRNIDVLLIDDIQFLIGKESTQEEFFHTFNHLYNARKQIIITSDRPPKDLKTLEDRLRTRFEMGLLADISTPDYETRIAILRKKIENDNLQRYNIPDDVLDYIATNIKKNIRELEGSLNKLIMLYKLNNSGSIDIGLASEALHDIISAENRNEVTPALILEVISEHYGVTVADLKSAKRTSDLVVPRQVAMYLIREMTENSLKGIGVILGGKDHSTIKHGIAKITENIAKDEVLANNIDIIKKKISPL